ncbi:hyaluronan and proteoglycan link protein 1-like [Brienomyrus brachyistius]|uniref:hyaluronan and proteoglycan link protein 1-like n=1 Tax=Brienomyrus brachyistius TaxID=42636 RepID=UPI0020B37421|nr:hyaluronan and proteoglycan link protein 1-like [Brienomyrus brachyistius]
MITLLALVLIFDHAYSNMDPKIPVYVSENGSRLSVHTQETKVVTWRGSNATLPCRLQGSSHDFTTGEMRIRWSKLSLDHSDEVDVLVSMGIYKKVFGSFHDRVYLREADENDASLVITNVILHDTGVYKCEIIDGMDDGAGIITLELQGVVFPYSPRLGRYNLNFYDAENACLQQDAIMASTAQLYSAWEEGFDWCNAGWLSDGSVQYPIAVPREPCGGKNAAAGMRSYGSQNKHSNHYDVFCFTSDYKGHFYFLTQASKLTYDEAVKACKKDGSEIAKVGQIYAAWKIGGYDRCDAGWLADGSVRYPISKPRKYCSPTEAAVRFVGFPDKKHKLYGVYCFKALE